MDRTGQKLAAEPGLDPGSKAARPGAGLSGGTPATQFAWNGVGLVQAQKPLGHSDPRLTASVYSHVDVEDLRGAVESLPPLKVALG